VLPAALALSAGAGLLIWGVAVGPRRLVVECHDLRLPHLPPCWAGERIALLADMQVGMALGNEAVAARAVRHVVAHRPAAVLLAGDYVLHPETEAERHARITLALDVLRPLTCAGLRVFAVLGNHDYQEPDDEAGGAPLERQVQEALESLGIDVLRNRSVPLRAPRGGTDDCLYIAGLGEFRMGDDDRHAAFAGVPSDAPRIVLVHNPEAFRRLPPYSAPVALAGHTHGSQVAFTRGAPRPWWMRAARLARDLQHGSGWAAEDFGQPGNRLYISRGIGFSRAPIRINAPPELTYFTLRPAA